MARCKQDFSKVAEVKLIYRKKIKPSERVAVTNSKDAYDLFLRTWNMETFDEREEFRVMLLDGEEGCIGISTVAIGEKSHCIVDLKAVFALAVKAQARSIILAHNHPSGRKIPSDQDKRLTDKFAMAAGLLDLVVLDHIIVTKNGYTSFTDDNLFFTLTPEEKRPGC